MKKFFLNARKRISLFVSLFFMLVLSIILIVSFLLSELTLKKLAQSNYFQDKVTKVLEKNKISSIGSVSINFNTISSADIKVEKATFSKLNNLVGHDINLKVDFMQYLLGSNFINEVHITTVEYNLTSDFSANLKGMASADLKLLIKSMHALLNKINSKSIYIENGSLKFLSQTFNMKKIKFLKDQKLLSAEASWKGEHNHGEIINAKKFNFSLNESSILKFNIDLKMNDYNDLFAFNYMPKVVKLLLGRLIKNSQISNKKSNKIKVVGTYDLNSTNLKLELSDVSNRFKVNLNSKILRWYEKNSLLLDDTELAFGDYTISASNANFDFDNSTFEINVIRFLVPHEDASVFPNEFKVFGGFSVESATPIKIKILGENQSDLEASLKIVKTKNNFNNNPSFDLFLKIDALKKISLNKVGTVLNFFSNEGKKGISLENATAQIGLKFGEKDLELSSFKSKINNLVYFENDKRLVELKNVNVKGNQKEAYAAVSLVTKLEPSIEIYRDINLELSSTGKRTHEKEVTLSFKSKINDLISLAPKTKTNLKWINSLVRSQGEKEVSITYSKAIFLNEIEKFFTLEENIFELSVKDLLIPLTAKNRIKLHSLNLKGIGNTILFEGKIAANSRKISGSINNWQSYFSSKFEANNLIIFFENLDSLTLFPNFSTFNVKGPLKLTFLPSRKDDNSFIEGNVDLTETDLYIPSLVLKKVKGKYGKFEFAIKKDNRSNFKYSQTDVTVSGTALHTSFFEIKKVNYSNIKTPDVQMKKATFQRFEEYNQFQTNEGTVSLDFLMRLNLKKKNIPHDLIFSNIAVTFKKNKFLDSLKGEIRSFNGLRGYAKAKLPPNSNLEIIISPHKNDQINLIITGNDAGELLRKGKYYENGYGGIFKASIFYKNKFKMSGSLEIEKFRVKNAPVLAQIISSASIIGLLDNLNGNGLLFTKIEGSFDYKDGELSLKDGVAVGPSLGLTMGGYERYEKNHNTINVNGLVSPVYIINGVVKAIPLIGKVLGGEKGEGVFGVSYKVKGNSSNPRVFVNPLSILTPGVFRKIFNVEENGNN